VPCSLAYAFSITARQERQRTNKTKVAKQNEIVFSGIKKKKKEKKKQQQTKPKRRHTWHPELVRVLAGASPARVTRTALQAWQLVRDSHHAPLAVLGVRRRSQYKENTYGEKRTTK
jgi:hypothetical protein